MRLPLLFLAILTLGGCIWSGRPREGDAPSSRLLAPGFYRLTVAGAPPQRVRLTRTPDGALLLVDAAGSHKERLLLSFHRLMDAPPGKWIVQARTREVGRGVAGLAIAEQDGQALRFGFPGSGAAAALVPAGNSPVAAE